MATSWKANGLGGAAFPGNPGDGGDAKVRLLKSAILLFAEQGYQGVGVREIAAAAEQNSALISHYFKGKEGLHRAAVCLTCYWIRGLVDVFPAFPGSGKAEARSRTEAALREAMGIILRSALPGSSPTSEERVLACASIRLFLRELAFPVPETEAMVRATARAHLSYMNRCIQIIRPELDAWHVLWRGMGAYGLMLSFLNYEWIVPSLGEDRRHAVLLPSLIDHITQFILRGLGPHPAHLPPKPAI
jgi:AcrR family transcriptional regulator